MYMVIPAYRVVADFEDGLAKYARSDFAVAVDSCTAAIFLCLEYFKANSIYGRKYAENIITIPKRTFPSIPMEILHAGYKLQFEDLDWKGIYQLKPLPIYDGAKRFHEGMYMYNSFHCLSFHYKKHLPIGRGGAILTNNGDAARWFRQARFFGRNEGVPLSKDQFAMCGWNLYMDPPRAARGLTLLSMMKDSNPDLLEDYSDLSKQKIFN